MDKEVFLEITGVQTNDEGTDQTELFTQGRYIQKGRSNYIVYDETETTGFEGCKTIVKVENEERVVMRRTGKSPSHLIIQKGVRNLGVYGTAAGDIQIGIYADKIVNRLDEHGGRVYFKYQLDINSVFISENEVTINIKECK